jgi:hypothetical protein
MSLAVWPWTRVTPSFLLSPPSLLALYCRIWWKFSHPSITPQWINHRATCHRRIPFRHRNAQTHNSLRSLQKNHLKNQYGLRNNTECFAILNPSLSLIFSVRPRSSWGDATAISSRKKSTTLKPWRSSGNKAILFSHIKATSFQSVVDTTSSEDDDNLCTGI